MILVDAGPLIAAFDTSDEHHIECAALLRDSTDELLVPQPIVAEVCYMIGRAHFGAPVEAMFLRSSADGALTAAALDRVDFERMAQLVEQYASLPLGGSDGVCSRWRTLLRLRLVTCTYPGRPDLLRDHS